MRHTNARRLQRAAYLTSGRVVQGVRMSSFLETDVAPGQRKLDAFLRPAQGGAGRAAPEDAASGGSKQDHKRHGWKQTFLDRRVQEAVQRHQEVGVHYIWKPQIRAGSNLYLNPAYHKTPLSAREGAPSAVGAISVRGSDRPRPEVGTEGLVISDMMVDTGVILTGMRMYARIARQLLRRGQQLLHRSLTCQLCQTAATTACWLQAQLPPMLLLRQNQQMHSMQMQDEGRERQQGTGLA